MNAFNWDGASEADVREEFIAPLLKRLGYARGSSFDIVRELTLRYDGISLGRRKSGDAKLQGRLDYLMKIVGGPRWILEAKPPHESIGNEAIGQALSYARHPEVSATFVVVTNGREFCLYGVNDRPTDSPLVMAQVSSVDQIYDLVASILTPGAIKRSFPIPQVSFQKPIASGLRGSERLSGGFIRCLWASWRSSSDEVDDSGQILDEMCRKLIGFQSDVVNGKVYRTDDGRIVADFEWAAPHAQLLKFALEKGLMEYKYICLDEEISRDEDKPTSFDYFSEVHIEEGEELFDITSWETTFSGVTQRMTISGQATGYLLGEVFCGLYESSHVIEYPAMPGYSVEVLVAGSFEVYLAN